MSACPDPRRGLPPTPVGGTTGFFGDWLRDVVYSLFFIFSKNDTFMLIPLLFTLLFSASFVFGEDYEDSINRIVANVRPKANLSDNGPASYNLVERMKFFSVPGVSIALSHGGKLAWARTFGVKDKDNLYLCDTNTLFQAASISKPISTTILLNLVEREFLELDKPVNFYLKDWRVPSSVLTETSPVTLRHLASHSAGMTVHGFPGYEFGQPLPTIPQILNGLTPANTRPVFVAYQPGEKFQYSGGGFCVIQLAITETANLDFESLAKKYVFQPTSMSRSTFQQPLSEVFLGNVAAGHSKDGTKIKGGWHIYPELAAAGLWTTPSDLLKWATSLSNAWQGNQSAFLSCSLAKEMLAAQAGGCGLGIFFRGKGDSFYFYHGGANAGYRSFLLFYPQTGNGIAIMCNGDGADELQSEIVSAVIAEYGWK